MEEDRCYGDPDLTFIRIIDIMREMKGDCFHVCSLLFLGGFFVHKAFCNIGKGAVCFLFFTYCVTKQFCGFVMSHAFSQCNQAAIGSDLVMFNLLSADRSE